MTLANTVTTMSALELSVVIPVYNEAGGLVDLFARLYPALDALGRPYEIIFVDDGSRDRSFMLLEEQYGKRPDTTHVIQFNANYGQHMAIVAGFEHCRGDRIITLDADLQNPPEEIGNLLQKMDQGHDYVGGIRSARHDAWWRDLASKAMNWLRQRITRIKITDQGCMLRAYNREIAQAVVVSNEVNTFIPALAYTFAHNPAEVYVRHAPRTAGKSKYSLYKLIRLNFDLITGFSLVPLQLFSMLGMVVSITSLTVYLIVIAERLALAGWREGIATLWDRDILAFFLIGVLLFGVGLVGEYVGRIYQQVRDRPRFMIRAILQKAEEPATSWTRCEVPRRYCRSGRGG